MVRPEAELSIVFVTDEEMARLNERYRKRVGPTNVLSFPLHLPGATDMHPEILGDVVISTETASKEAENVGISLEEQIDRLLVHGVLHLLGYDHQKSKEEHLMSQKEKEMLDLLRRE